MKVCSLQRQSFVRNDKVINNRSSTIIITYTSLTVPVNFVTLLRDFEIKMDRTIQSRKLDFVIVILKNLSAERN